jgi:hypothetical protein
MTSTIEKCGVVEATRNEAFKTRKGRDGTLTQRQVGGYRNQVGPSSTRSDGYQVIGEACQVKRPMRSKLNHSSSYDMPHIGQ